MLYRALRRFTFAKAMIGREPFYVPNCALKTEFHGSSYGGWSILEDSLTQESVVYSFGLGEDVSFDQSILLKYDCRLFGFDPTAQAIDWARANMTHRKFAFHASALSTSDKPLRMFFPDASVADQVSASAIFNGASSSSYFDATANTLGHYLDSCTQGKCDLLKMDIEGSEYGVLAQAVGNNWLFGVKQLLVEFHHWKSAIGPQATRQTVSQLKQSGFRIAWISRTNHEYLFVR